MFHVRADMDDKTVARLANAFGSHVIIASEGSGGTLRREATEDGIPTITIEMGEAHRFERQLIEEALHGVRSVFAEYGLYPRESVRWPGWRTTIEGWGERTWLRADTGGIVDMHHDRGEIVHEDDAICTITSPFKTNAETVRAPFTGLLVGVLENPVAYPGNPLCHFAEIEESVIDIIEDREGIDETGVR
jgi:hypothetical protein